MIEKLCFPLIGPSGIGKTHWLAKVYSEINQGIYPADANISPTVWHSGDYELDIPVVEFEFLDTSRCVRTRVITPEVNPRVDTFRVEKRSFIRWVKQVCRNFGRTAVFRRGYVIHVESGYEVRGVILFLDPTDQPGVYTQVKALREIRDWLKYSGFESRLKIPVALCVSKIDLLPNQKFGKGDNINQFYNDIKKVGKTFSLEAMEERSRIVSRLSDTMWPGWAIENEITEIFGGRHLFFPLTPVGLENIGEGDQSKVTVNPFAIQEPLYWLMHMSGYSVF